MKFLKRLMTGQIELWRVFWLIGTPLALVWDVTGVCMVLGIGVEQLFLAGLIITLFTLSSVLTPFVAVAIWRSASNYPRKTGWSTAFAIAAKLSAVFSGLIGVLSILGLLYLGYDVFYAFIIPD
jgi:hypothetical protein